MALSEQGLDQRGGGSVFNQAREFYSKRLPIDASKLSDDELILVLRPPLNDFLQARPFLDKALGKMSNLLLSIPSTLPRFWGTFTGM